MTPALVSIIIIVYFAVSIGMSIIPSNGADRDIFLPQTGRHPDAIKPARFFSDFPNDRFHRQALSCSLPAAEGKSTFTISNAFTLNLPIIKYTV
jgi:hypothetical protein